VGIGRGVGRRGWGVEDTGMNILIYIQMPDK